MPEIEGILERVNPIYGKWELKDLHILVGGIDFYKKIWKLDKKTEKRFRKKMRSKGITELLFSQVEEYYFPKEKFIKELQENIGNKIKVIYEEANTARFYWILDNFLGLKSPKKYREIINIEYF